MMILLKLENKDLEYFKIIPKGENMKLEDQFKYLVGAYYGIRSVDNYDLKIYILKDIENYIKKYIKANPIPNYNYKEEAEKINEERSLKTKLQDSLLVLPKIDAPMELVFLVKEKIRIIKENELKNKF